MIFLNNEKHLKLHVFQLNSNKSEAFFMEVKALELEGVLVS